MKLFYLIVIFSLFCAGCDKDPRMVAEVGEIRNGKLVASGSGGEITLTHRADNDEKVHISYENPQNGKKVTDFEIKPEQCVIFKEEQVKFVNNIKVGLGFESFSVGSRIVCGDGDGDGEFLQCNVILDNGSYEIIDISDMWVFDKYILKPSERNTSPACQYFEDIL